MRYTLLMISRWVWLLLVALLQILHRPDVLRFPATDEQRRSRVGRRQIGWKPDNVVHVGVDGIQVYSPAVLAPPVSEVGQDEIPQALILESGKRKTRKMVQLPIHFLKCCNISLRINGYKRSQI